MALRDLSALAIDPHNELTAAHRANRPYGFQIGKQRLQIPRHAALGWSVVQEVVL
jgi:hypothetical protein